MLMHSSLLLTDQVPAEYTAKKVRCKERFGSHPSRFFLAFSSLRGHRRGVPAQPLTEFGSEFLNENCALEIAGDLREPDIIGLRSFGDMLCSHILKGFLDFCNLFLCLLVFYLNRYTTGIFVFAVNLESYDGNIK